MLPIINLILLCGAFAISIIALVKVLNLEKQPKETKETKETEEIEDLENRTQNLEKQIGKQTEVLDDLIKYLVDSQILPSQGPIPSIGPVIPK